MRCSRRICYMTGFLVMSFGLLWSLPLPLVRSGGSVTTRVFFKECDRSLLGALAAIWLAGVG